MTVLNTSEDGRSLLPSRAAQLAALQAGAPAPAAPAPAPEAPEAEALTAGEVVPFDLDALTASITERMTGGLQLANRHPLSVFSTLSDFAAAARAGDGDALAAFAIADQITTDNPGVIPPGWLTDVKGIIDRGARAITAFGGPAGLPDAGMDVSWPYFDGNLTTIVGEQATEKTDVTSVKVSLKKGNAPLKTFAGGSDVAWQLIARSAPSYQDAYLRILAAAYAIVTDAQFVGDLVGVANTTAQAPIVLDITAAGTTADQVREAFFTASARVDIATGAPANAALAGTKVFTKLGGKPGLVPAPYGTQNVSGTADAGSLRVEVSGITVHHCPTMADDVTILGNDQAARWHGSGAMFASADDVLKLGTDTVVWGMGATGIYTPAGVVAIVKTAPTK